MRHRAREVSTYHQKVGLWELAVRASQEDAAARQVFG